MPLAIPALIAAAATVGSAVYSANAANDANDKALSAQNAATQQSLAAQQAALAQITALNQPFINAGTSALNPLANRIATGAPNFSAPTYALPQPGGIGPQAPTPDLRGTIPAAGGGASTPTTATTPATATPAPSGEQQPDTNPFGGAPTGAAPPSAPTAAPAGVTGGPDWNAYLAQNPDIATYYAQTPAAQTVSLQDFAQQVSQAQGDIRGPVPTLAPIAPPDLGTGSPVVANYTRPDQGTGPDSASYFDPSQFTTSPGYQFRLDQGLRNTNASFGAKGLLQSGAALQGFNDYAQNSASQEYQNWFNQQNTKYQDAQSAFIADRNNTNQNFADDRSYGTNLAINNRDFATNQYNTGTNNLFQLAGLGANAAGAVSGAVTNNANNSSNIFQNQGTNAANSALATGATNAQLGGTIGSTVANLFNGPTRFGSSSGVPAGNSPTGSYAPGTTVGNAFGGTW